MTLLRKNIFLTFSRQLFVAAMQLMIVLIIARNLGPEGNGLYAMGILIPSLLVNFLNFGIGPATVFYIGNGELSLIQAYKIHLSIAFKIIILGVFFALPVLFFFGETLFPSVPLSILLVGLIAFPSSLLLSFWLTIYQGMEDFRTYNLLTLAIPVVTLLLTVIMLLGFEFNVLCAVIAHVFGQLVGLILVWVHLKHFRVGNLSVSDSIQEKRLFNYGWKSYFSNIMTFINYRADVFLINFLIGPVATGVYVVAVQFAEKLWMLSQAVSTVLFPRFAAMSEQKLERHRLSVRAGWVVGVLTLSAALVVTALLYFFLVPVFGDEFQPAFEPFVLLLPGVIFLAIARVYANTIAAAGKPEWNMYASIFVVMVNICGNFILIPKLGLVGAAIATSLAYGLNFFIKLMIILKMKATSVMES